MPTRQEVYRVIDGERDYQEMRKKRDGTHPTDRDHTPEEYLVYMKVYLDKAFEISTITWGADAPEKTLDFIRKVTALGVAAMEGNGAPERKAYLEIDDSERHERQPLMLLNEEEEESPNAV